MIGIVTMAVRDTMTNAMLTMKPSEIAPSARACQILFIRSRLKIGYASATAHSANSWL